MRKLLFFLLIFCSVATSGIAQQYNFKRFSVEEGLSRSGVYCLLEDSRGFLWVGTEGGGLARFDGRQFVTFTTENGLADNTVRSLFEDRDGNLWIGTNGHGLSKFDGQIFETFTIENGLSNNYIRCITQGPDGAIWIGTFGGGINRLTFDNDTLLVSVFDANGSLESDKVRAAICDADGILWFGTDEGLHRFDGENWVIYNKSSGLSHKRILTLFEDNLNNLWIGTQSGANKMTTEGFVNLSTDNGLINNRIRGISQDDSGNIWFGTQKGISRFDGENFISFTEENGLSNDRIRHITSDRSGNLWFGTFFGGICRFSGEEFIHFTEQEGISNNQVLSVYTSNDGDIWLGTLEGITELKPRQNGIWEVLQHPLGGNLSERKVNTIVRANDDATWFGTDAGIFIKKEKKVSRLRIENQPFTEDVKAILFEPDGAVWIGSTQGAGLYKKTGAGYALHQYHSHGNMNTSEVSHFMRDARGGIWIAYLKANPVLFENNDFTALDLPKPLRNIAAIIEGPNGYIWFATTGNGLFRLSSSFEKINANSLKHFGIAEGLSSTNLHQLTFDNQKNLWVGTVSGIDKITFDGEGEITTVKRFGQAEGFLGVETNENAICIDNNGNLWFGTIKGAARYNGKKAQKNIVENSIHITDIELEFKNTDWGKSNYSEGIKGHFGLPKKLHLPYSANGLEITYNGINLRDPDQVRYQWKLEGYSSEWSMFEAKNSHSFTNLKPGTYTFYVRSVNSAHIWNEHAATFSFIVLPPVWMRWWFVILCAVLLIIIIRGMLKFREKELLEEKNKLEIKVNERTRELRKEKDRSDELLLNILPSETAEELKLNGYASVRYYERVSVLFTDFVGFTAITEDISHKELIRLLDEHFRMFDEVMDCYGVEKIKTIGDAYMAAGGIPTKSNYNPLSVVMAALEMTHRLTQLNAKKELNNEKPWKLRAGVHTGSVISGVVGKNKFAFDIWGDAVNTAARMESSGDIMKVNISDSTYKLVNNYFECTSRGKIKAKNKGEIEMYFVNRLRPEFAKTKDGLTPNAAFFELIGKQNVENIKINSTPSL